MTKLWEDTVVISLRDSQWLHCKNQPPKAVAPPLFLKMDGNPESALGDVLFASNARYYLIEVKSSAGDIKSEWSGGTSGDKKKRVYIALAERWKQLHDAVRDDDKAEVQRLAAFFAASLSCHLLSYWEQWVLEGVSVGDVVITPYLSGCIAAYGGEDDRGGEFISNVFRNTFSIGKQRAGRFFVSEVASVDLLFEKSAHVYTAAHAEKQSVLQWSRPLGLSLEELQHYVDELTEDEVDDLEMHGILLDTSGQVFKSYSSIGQLKLALDPYAQSRSVLKSPALRLRDLARPSIRKPGSSP